MNDELDPRSPGPPPLPGWLKVLVAVGLLLLLAVAVLTVFGGVSHGPWMHGPG